MLCVGCSGEQRTKAGCGHQGRQLFWCAGGGRRQTERSASAFSGSRFPDEIIALAVHWYLRFRLSYTDLVDLVAERGIQVDPSSCPGYFAHLVTTVGVVDVSGS